MRMKFLFDFFPIILFFGSFKFAEGERAWAAEFLTEHLGFAISGGRVGPQEAPVMLATAVVVAATLAQVLWLKLRRRKVDTMLWMSLVLVAGLGSATLWFHDETFIKWKPSALYWLMGLAFWLAPLVARRNLLKLLLGEQLVLPDRVWHRLNFAWVAFFGVMGLLNLWVAYSFSTETWVDFKLFGGIGLTLLFTLGQALYLGRYLKGDSSVPESTT
jgi:intracellular septation protein